MYRCIKFNLALAEKAGMKVSGITRGSAVAIEASKEARDKEYLKFLTSTKKCGVATGFLAGAGIEYAFEVHFDAGLATVSAQDSVYYVPLTKFLDDNGIGWVEV